MSWKDAPAWLRKAAKQEGWDDDERLWRGLRERFAVEFPVRLDPIYDASRNYVGIMATGLRDPAPSAEFARVDAEVSEPTLKALNTLYRRLLDFKEEKTKKESG